LAVVNIVKLHSNLLIIGPDERALACASFEKGTLVGDADSADTMNLGSLVSRKKDFIPAVTKAIKGGFRLVSGN
jgi:inorganic pyrophosphatase/exopolyphosphatase